MQVFCAKKVFTNTIFYQILVFGDTNACLLPHRACCNEIVMAVLEGCLAGECLEDAVESLVGREAAQRNSMGECLVVIGVLRIDKDSLGILHTITGNILRRLMQLDT